MINVTQLTAAASKLEHRRRSSAAFLGVKLGENAKSDTTICEGSGEHRPVWPTITPQLFPSVVGTTQL